jgi:macrolide-specific efflux system membrane fusion protein
VGALLVVAALSIGLWLWLGGAKAPGVLLTETLSRRDIASVVLASGTLQPVHTVSVGAQVSGQLKRLHVTLGQAVRRGQLLAEIDPRLALNDLQIAQADLAKLGAEERGLLARRRQAARELDRQWALQQGGVSSQREREQAQLALQRLDADLAAIRASIQRARHVVEQERTKLAYSRIEAPIDGLVLTIDTLEGQTVIASQQAPTILKLGDLSRIKIKAHVSEADIMRVKLGQTARFSLLGDPDKYYDGKVEEILPTPEKINNAMFFDVQFSVDNRNRQLRSEMTAQVTIVLDEARQALAVPLMALDEEEGPWYSVRIVRAEGAEETKRVRIGLRGQTHAQVLEGLAAGDKVVLSAPTSGETHRD